jgi:TolB-like protein/DNA-binding winged helix-turn-helix (wHTH) protein
MSEIYQFEEFALDPKKRTLTWDASTVHLTPKTFDILLFLVRNPNRVVSKQELMKAVWPDTHVEEGNLTFNVSVLRKTLAEYAPDNQLIVTLARQGYQFTADVTAADGRTPPPSTSSNAPQPLVTGAKETRWRRWPIVGALSVITLLAAYLGWQRSRTAAPGGSETRLAVLPCRNLTGDATQEYLADGITEELISRLAQLDPQKLSVIALTSVMGYKQPRPRLQEIGRDLGVQRVLESSIRSSAGRLRITVQLIDVTNQSHLWSSDYDYRTGEMLELEDAVARAVARQIQLGLAPNQQRGLERSRTVAPQAIDAYLRGHYLFEHPTKDNLDQAVGYFEQSITRDSAYALAWVGLSHARRRQAEYAFIPYEDGYRQAREAADRALVLDPDLGAAYANLAWIQINHDWDWDGAHTSAERALSLNPGDAETVSIVAFLSAILGRYDEALTAAQRAVALDPLAPGVHEGLGQIYLALNRSRDAIPSYRTALQLSRDSSVYQAELGLAYLSAGRASDALREIEKEPSPPWRLRGEALANYQLGRRREADSILAELTAQQQAHAAYQIAEIHAFRGETDQAFQWLERAYAQRDGGVPSTRMDPLLNNLRSDPRYNAFLAKVRLPQ